MEAIRRARDKRSGAAATIVGQARPAAAPGIWYAAFAQFLAGALLIVSSGLLLRRLSGGMTSPLGAWALVTAGLLAVIVALGVRLLWWHGGVAGVGSWAAKAMRGLPTVALVFFALSISLQGSSIGAVVFVCALIGTEGFLAALLERGTAYRSNLAVAGVGAGATMKNPARLTPETSADLLRDGVIRQQFRRKRLDGERELVHGTIRVSFSPGQRTAIEHLVFCPMFARLPTIRVEMLDGSGGAARPTHIYRYGARLEVKLSEPCDEPFEALVRYEARG